MHHGGLVQMQAVCSTYNNGCWSNGLSVGNLVLRCCDNGLPGGSERGSNVISNVSGIMRSRTWVSGNLGCCLEAGIGLGSVEGGL